MKMKTAMKKLFSLVLVAVLLVGVMPFQAFANTTDVWIELEPGTYTVNDEFIQTYYTGTGTPTKYFVHNYAYQGKTFTLSETTAVMLAIEEFAPAAEPDVCGNCSGSHKTEDCTLVECTVCDRWTDHNADAHCPECDELKSVCPVTCPGNDNYVAPEPEAPADITWELKHVSGGEVVKSGTFTPSRETANVKDILYYHVFNRSNDWKQSYTCTKVWSEKNQADVTYEGSVPAGDTVSFVLTPIAPSEPEDPVKAMYSVTFNLNKDGVNSTFSRTYEEGTVLTLNYALVNEVTFGNAEVEWVVNGSHKEKNATIIVDGPMTISCSITNNATEKKTISLDVNGGRLQSYESSKYTVVIGQPYGNLPTPTREGYTFAYWYYKDSNGNEQRVDKNTIVTIDSRLYAKWIANGITVTFQRYDMLEGWVDVETHTVPVNSVLTVEDGTFPSNSRIDLVYDIPDFEIVGWEIGDTDKAFKANSTKVTSEITLRPRYQGKVRLVAQEPVSGASWKSFYVTLEIGEVIGGLKNPGSRSTFAFAGWVASNGSDMICDEYCNSKLEYYPHLYGTTFYSVWAGGITVRLHIHTNGNIASASKIVPYYVAPATGKFDLNAIDMYSIYSSYYKYDDDCDAIDGWYDAEEWKNFCANRASHPATSYMNIEENNQFDFHIMMYDLGEDDYYSSSSSADSSNPKTGDMIMTPVIVLCASVGALATLFYLNKKRSV